MSDPETIARYRRELRADPASLRFVPLAEALRRVGRLVEAEDVLADGLILHPGLNSGRLVLARVYADSDSRAAALSILDELYPRDSGNVALVSLYLELLVDAGRMDDARVLLDRAEIIGVPAEVRQSVMARIEASLWAEREADAAVVTPIGPPTGSREALREPITLPDTNLKALVDPFAIEVVAERLERAGRFDAALRIWEELAMVRPLTPEFNHRVVQLRLRREPSLITLDPGLLRPESRPVPDAVGRGRLLQLGLRLRARAQADRCR